MVERSRLERAGRAAPAEREADTEVVVLQRVGTGRPIVLYVNSGPDGGIVAEFPPDGGTPVPWPSTHEARATLATHAPDVFRRQFPHLTEASA